MQVYNRTDKDAKCGHRILTITNCYRDCPYAKEKYNTFSCNFYFTCELTGIEYNFADNLIHFSTPEDCPLDKLQDDE